MIVLALIALGAFAAWCVSLLIHPWTTCGRCKGERVNRGSKRKRFGMCKRCAGTGRRRRFGATTVHRVLWSVLGDRLLERHREDHKKAQDRAGYPEL